jgi:hypothetical protein
MYIHIIKLKKYIPVDFSSETNVDFSSEINVVDWSLSINTVDIIFSSALIMKSKNKNNVHLFFKLIFDQ